MLIDTINSDFITAYKAKDELNIAVLRLLKSALKNEEIAKKTPLADDDAVRVLKRELKQRKDSAAEYKSAGQTEKADREEAEAKIIEKYLPNQLDETSIREIAKAKISNSGAVSAKDMGRIIGSIMSEHGGEVDGAIVSKVVRELLS